MSENKSPLIVPQSAKHYQLLARRTQNTELSTEDKRKHAVFGLCSEAGEIASLFQHVYQGAEVSKEKVIDECGDLCWFLCELLDTYNTPIMEVFKRNIAKLSTRYPQGFSIARSENRHSFGED